MSKGNFFLATLIGITPQIFLIVSVGNGLETIINNNLTTPGIKDIITTPDIYLPLVIFAILVLLQFF